MPTNVVQLSLSLTVGWIACEELQSKRSFHPRIITVTEVPLFQNDGFLIPNHHLLILRIRAAVWTSVTNFSPDDLFTGDVNRSVVIVLTCEWDREKHLPVGALTVVMTNTVRHIPPRKVELDFTSLLEVIMVLIIIFPTHAEFVFLRLKVLLGTNWRSWHFPGLIVNLCPSCS